MAKKEYTIEIPVLHQGQIQAHLKQARFKALRCGRRWGKTQYEIALVGSCVARGEALGFFAPDYKILAETYNEIHEILSPIVLSKSKVEGVIRCINGGRVDFWTLNNPRAGRSRRYHGVLMDEVAFAGPDMKDIWEKSIKPTLLDFKGWALAASTPAGEDPENFFYDICNNPLSGFEEFHAPTSTNPYLPADEIAKLERDNDPRVYRQEYLAEFVNWDGAAFFSLDKLLVEGKGLPNPRPVDQVFAVVDTALKDTLEHDGTAVTYFSTNRVYGTPLVILDWDVIQIEGSFLDAWLPSVVTRCEELARETGARQGSVGVYVEDKASGIVLIQQAQRKGMPVYAIQGDLVAMGKDGRALSVSGYVHRGDVKLSEYAYNKTLVYRQQSRNHLISQVCGYRLGNKTPHQQDLLDTFCYGVAIALGDVQGY